jgi:internalin A
LPTNAEFCFECGTSQTDSIAVVFPDENLEAAVRKALEKPEEPLTRGDLKRLDELDAELAEIENLFGLEHATNLTELVFNNNQISDISPLASLTKLTELRLADNQISDISPLANLTNLTVLNLEYNQISDISTLASLTNLTMLDLRDNPLSHNPLIHRAQQSGQVYSARLNFGGGVQSGSLPRNHV